MLKKQIEVLLDESEASLYKKSAECRQLKDIVATHVKEIERLEGVESYQAEQLKQISQSIYTMLQVKYPEYDNSEDECEDKRLLMFLHGLCIDRNYSVNDVSDVFRHMSR